jgi:hypothetical protein
MIAIRNRADVRPASDSSSRERPQPTSSVRPVPQVVANGSDAGLHILLQLEADARAATTCEELQFLAANDTRKLTKARQIFVFRMDGEDLKIRAISGFAALDHNSPMVRGIESILKRLGESVDLNHHHEFMLARYIGAEDGLSTTYPFQHALWLPFSRSGALLGGMLLAREAEGADDLTVGKRLADIFSHALSLLLVEDRFHKRITRKLLSLREWALFAAALIMAGFQIPVSMTTLSPAEVVPNDPVIIAAPFDGVIEAIPVEPSDAVGAGATLVQFASISLRNRLELAQQEVEVAQARLRKATQLAFGDANGRHELGVTLAELKVKTVERDYALDMLRQATIKAPNAGVTVFSDKQALLGKPVAVGERIMQLANPSKIEIAIDVAVSDAVEFKADSRVKVFLDSEPLRAREARIVSADYLASVRPNNALAFRVIARLEDAQTSSPRIGARGSAEIYGGKVKLAFYLFRRPLSTLRQWIAL